MSDRLQYVSNMTVRQAEIDKSGDTQWYVVNASGYKVSGGFAHRSDAELHLAWIRHRADEDPED